MKASKVLVEHNNNFSSKFYQISVSNLESFHRSLGFKILEDHGALLIRPEVAHLDDFSKFVNRLCPQTAIDPARSFFAKNVQLVDSGHDAIGLHCENGTTPLVPNFVFFYCEKAPSVRSQTTICDGNLVWEHMSDKSKNMLLENRINYSRKVPRELWSKYFVHHFKGFSSKDSMCQDVLNLTFGKIPGCRVIALNENEVELSHSSFAVHPDSFGQNISFANSLFGPSYNYEKPSIKFENGNEIPKWLLSEVKYLSEKLTSDINWRKNDLLILDNWRFMHGRRKIEDTNRKLFTALGFLFQSNLKSRSRLESECYVG